MKFVALIIGVLSTVAISNSTPQVEFTDDTNPTPGSTIEIGAPDTVINFNRRNIYTNDPALVLAAVAAHECGSLSTFERWLVMEAAWNRAVTNFGKHGTRLGDQLTAPRQMGSLFIKRPNKRNKFQYNGHKVRHRNNYLMALRIVGGERKYPDNPIVYWAGTMDPHYNWCRKYGPDTSGKTVQAFCYDRKRIKH